MAVKCKHNGKIFWLEICILKSTPRCRLFVEKSELKHNFLYARFLLIPFTADELMTYPPLKTILQFLLDTENEKKQVEIILTHTHTIHLPNIKQMVSKYLWTQFSQSLWLPSLDDK